MKTYTKLVLYIFLSLSAGIASASNWFVLLPTVDGGTESVDLSSIIVKGNLVTAWFMSSSPVEQKFNGYSATVQTDKPYKSMKEQRVMNCATREGAGIHVAYYSEENGQGTYLGSIAVPPAGYVFRSVIPDTQGEMRLDYLCKYAARKVKPST